MNYRKNAHENPYNGEHVDEHKVNVSVLSLFRLNDRIWAHTL